MTELIWDGKYNKAIYREGVLWFFNILVKITKRLKSL